MSDPLDEWRQIIAQEMREDDPDVTEEQIREAQERATGSVVWKGVRSRRKRDTLTIQVVGGAIDPVPVDVEAEVRRRLTPTPGRPPGRKSRVRAELVAEVAAHPDMTDEEIDRLGVERGAWIDALDDPATTRRRVRQLRKDASADE